jgi:D-3-phosphoglycerate dehydrogenase
MDISMPEYKVVITARSFGEGSDEPFRILRDAGYKFFKNKCGKPLTAGELAPLVEDADALIPGNDIVNEQVINLSKRLKVISRYGVGYDNIDLNAARRRGIVVTNTPNTNDNSVADLAFALILSLARNIPSINNIVKNGEWKRILGTEVWGKTLGIIGLGRIGKGVALRAKGFNMNILCCERFPDYGFAKENGIKYCSLQEVLSESDFISVHVPLLPDTRHFINREAFSIMKPGAYLVNTARGGVIDEAALYEALSSKRIAGAALDVTGKEPPKGSPLLELDNIIITSHIGGYTYDAVKNMGVAAARNVVLVLSGKPGAHIVNP